MMFIIVRILALLVRHKSLTKSLGILPIKDVTVLPLRHLQRLGDDRLVEMNEEEIQNQPDLTIAVGDSYIILKKQQQTNSDDINSLETMERVPLRTVSEVEYEKENPT